MKPETVEKVKTFLDVVVHSCTDENLRWVAKALYIDIIQDETEETHETTDSTGTVPSDG